MIIPAIAYDPGRIYVGTVLFMAVVSAGVAAYVALISAPNAGPDWLWRGGRFDLVRGIFFRRDGSWRRFGRLGAIVAPAVIFVAGYLLDGK